MKTLEAYVHFAGMNHDEWDFPLPPQFRDHKYIPAMLTAAADLSGGLDEAETDDDLKELAQHFMFLLDSEIISIDDWVTEANQIEEMFLIAGASAEQIEAARPKQ